MRARRKKNLVPRLEKCSDYCTDKIEPAGDRPVYLEIGCGKGKMATEICERDNVQYFGMEKIADVAVMAAEKAAEKNLNNLRFIIGDANDLDEKCPPKCIDILFLTFSDPWPKSKHAKRRLTYHAFLEKYRRILKDDGYIFFKTDNRPLFDFSVEEAKEHGFEVFDYTEDLHNSEIYNPGMTEYEIRFSSQGLPIYHCKFKPSVLKKSDVIEIDQKDGDISRADT